MPKTVFYVATDKSGADTAVVPMLFSPARLMPTGKLVTWRVEPKDPDIGPTSGIQIGEYAVRVSNAAALTAEIMNEIFALTGVAVRAVSSSDPEVVARTEMVRRAREERERELREWLARLNKVGEALRAAADGENLELTPEEMRLAADACASYASGVGEDY